MVKMREIDLGLIPPGNEKSQLAFLLRIDNSIFELIRARLRNPNIC